MSLFSRKSRRSSKDINSNRLSTLLAAGDVANREQRWQDAAEAYRGVLAIDDGLQPVWIQFGHALKERGLVSDAIDAYRKAIALLPSDADAHLQIGHAYKIAGDLAAARAAYAESQRLDPMFRPAAEELEALEKAAAGPFIVAGDAANAARRWRQAEHAYRKALDIDGSLHAIWVQYGHSLKEQGKVKAALEAYRRAVVLKVDDSDAHIQLGHAQKMLGRINEARLAYAEAARLRPVSRATSDEWKSLKNNHSWSTGQKASILAEVDNGHDAPFSFDANWYAEQYSDVQSLGMDPAEHYQWIGRRLGRRPAPDNRGPNANKGSLSEPAYAALLRVEQNAAAIQSNLFSRHAEVRVLKQRISQSGTSQQGLESAALTLLRAVYKPLSGSRERIAKSRLVDVDWYLQTYPDVAESGIDPIEHYLTKGVLEGRNPNSHFDTAWYLVNNPDAVVEGINPLLHFNDRGWLADRDPSPRFNTASYVRAFPDLQPSFENPLSHFLALGADQFYRTADFPVQQLSAPPASVTPVPIEATFGALEFQPASEFMIFRMNSPANKFADITRFHGISPEHLAAGESIPEAALRLVPLLPQDNFIELTRLVDYPSSHILRIVVDLQTLDGGKLALRYTTKSDATYNNQKCVEREIPPGRTTASFTLGSDHLSGPLRLAFDVNGTTLLYSVSIESASKPALKGPAMTFVIPCFNHGEYVTETVESIRAIPEANLYEIIIVDDGSTDLGCIAALNRLADEGITLIRQVNQGLGAARNNGIKSAQGRYILPVDADNKLRPAYFYRSLEMFETDPEVGVVFSDVQFFGADTRRNSLPDHRSGDQFIQNRIDACAALRKEVWQQVGGYQEQMIGYQDWEFWTAVDSLRYWKFYHLTDIGFDYRVQAGSMVAHTVRFHEEILDYISARHVRSLRHNFRMLQQTVDDTPPRSKELGAPIVISTREKAPLVTVIAPNFNKAPYLHARLDSIYKQTYRNFEVVILDDNSSDNSKSVIDKFSKRDKTSCVLYNENNSGNVFRQWRKGIEQAQGDIIWIAECDDYCDIRFLERLVPSLTSSFNVGVAYAQSNYVDQDGKIFGSHIESLRGLDKNLWLNDFLMDGPEFVRRFLRRMNCLPNASGIIFKKDLVSLIDWDEVTSYGVCGDWWIWAKFLMNANVTFCSEPLNYFRFDTTTARSKASRDLSRVREHLRILTMIDSGVGLSSEQRIDAVAGFRSGLQKHLTNYGADESELLALLTELYKVGGNVSVGVPLMPEANY